MTNRHCSLCRGACDSPTGIFTRQPGGEYLCDSCLYLYQHSSDTPVQVYVGKHSSKVKSFQHFEGATPHFVVGFRTVGSGENKKIKLDQPLLRPIKHSDHIESQENKEHFPDTVATRDPDLEPEVHRSSKKHHYTPAPLFTKEEVAEMDNRRQTSSTDGPFSPRDTMTPPGDTMTSPRDNMTPPRNIVTPSRDTVTPPREQCENSESDDLFAECMRKLAQYKDTTKRKIENLTNKLEDCEDCNTLLRARLKKLEDEKKGLEEKLSSEKVKYLQAMRFFRDEFNTRLASCEQLQKEHI